MKFLGVVGSLLAVVNAAVVWDGSFDPYVTSADFDKWSWSNQVGAYQWYIHGSQSTSRYLNPSTTYNHPGVSRDKTGLKLTVDGTSSWNGQSMMRTEIIPQTKANLGTGQLFYHFSLRRAATRGPGSSEHQIMFFESHFTELKTGVGSNPNHLSWCIGGQPKWSTEFLPDVWYNFAYDINFSSRTVGLYFSKGSDPLARVQSNQSASTSTNSADFHVGVLKFDQTAEDWYVARVFIESGTITTAIGNGVVAPPTTVTTVAPPVTEPPPVATTAPEGTVQKYGQCGGANYSGPTGCVAGLTCTAVNDFYHQCL